MAARGVVRPNACPRAGRGCWTTVLHASQRSMGCTSATSQGTHCRSSTGCRARPRPGLGGPCPFTLPSQSAGQARLCQARRTVTSLSLSLRSFSTSPESPLGLLGTGCQLQLEQEGWGGVLQGPWSGICSTRSRGWGGAGHLEKVAPEHESPHIRGE